MKVILAEKPSVALDIAKTLGATHKQDGHFSGNGFAVTWALGHLVTISEPEVMNPAWGQPWTANSLPMVPAQWHYTITDRTRPQFERIEALLHDPATEEVICATDAGREGEHIFRLIYAQARCQKSMKRLWISALTEEAIRAGFRSLQPGSAFDSLAEAAMARAHADWLVGLNATRAYTLHNHQKCTIGRVQTPTLALLVQRQKEISSFVETSFYEVHAHLEPGCVAKYIDAKGETALTDKAEAEERNREITPIPLATVQSVESQDKSLSPPPLFDLVILQREANEKLGYTAQETLEIAQSLYETHKLLSYPRTESRHLSTTMLDSLPAIAKALPKEFDTSRQVALSRLNDGPPLSKLYVDNTKLTDHHALIPTNRPEPAALPSKEKALYRLVAGRFLAIFLPNAIRSETTAFFAIGPHSFRAKGSVYKEQGWMALQRPDSASEQEADEDREQTLPALTPGQFLRKKTNRVVEKKRRPPRPFTDATLLAAMRSAGRLVDDDSLAEYMKHNGLGTAATRAVILKRLIASEYVLRQKKALIPTPKGMALIDQVAPTLKNPVMTAEWERRLKEIEHGSLSRDRFESDIATFVRELIPQVLSTPTITRSAEAADSALPLCPACKMGRVRQISSENTDSEKRLFYGCSNYKRGCTFSINGTIAGRALTPAVVKRLCEKGSSNPRERVSQKERQRDFRCGAYVRSNLPGGFSVRPKANAHGGGPTGLRLTENVFRDAAL